MAIQHLTVMGAGAWGTALAMMAARSGIKVSLWAFEESVSAEINKDRENKTYLPGVQLPDTITATHKFSDISQSDCIFFVTPAQHFRAISEKAGSYIAKDIPVVMCSKGIEMATGKLMSEVAAITLPQNPFSVLSGPSFAREVAEGQPTALTWAGESDALISELAAQFSDRNFRIYTSDDVIGAQIGGAIKNVLAIACGIVMGKKYGANAHAALITRGFSEMCRLASAMGAKEKTLSGLSGLGDLILTCSSTQSRNMSLGYALGEGKTMEETLAIRNSVAEGVHTSQIVSELASQHNIEMPICEAIRKITTGGAKVDDVITDLLSRPISSE